jgi:hypothetical protein
MKEESEKRQEVKLRRSAKEARYANYFQVGYNAFEFLLEFGQHEGRIHTSIYMSPQHARLFRDVLQNALDQFEATYEPRRPAGE